METFARENYPKGALANLWKCVCELKAPGARYMRLAGVCCKTVSLCVLSCHHHETIQGLGKSRYCSPNTEHLSIM